MTGYPRRLSQAVAVTNRDIIFATHVLYIQF